VVELKTRNFFPKRALTFLAWVRARARQNKPNLKAILARARGPKPKRLMLFLEGYPFRKDFIAASLSFIFAGADFLVTDMFSFKFLCADFLTVSFSFKFDLVR